MVNQISVVINTFNEEKQIQKLIESLGWAAEIVAVDDESTDKTFEILQNLKRNDRRLLVFKHKSAGFVEPARNFAIAKASNDWILILDADEIIPVSLADRLVEIASSMNEIDYVRLPRRNTIFGHFMKASMWWPDYNIRFFRKGSVKWGNQIHRPPQASGEGLDLPAEEKYAIIHQNYTTVSQFLTRMDRYTSIQAEELDQKGDSFEWKDLFEKPLGEFLSRYFAGRGYEDGLHGLALSLLQAVSFFVVYLKLWEITKFKEQEISLSDLNGQKNKTSFAIDYWFAKSKSGGNFLSKLFKKR